MYYDLYKAARSLNSSSVNLILHSTPDKFTYLLIYLVIGFPSLLFLLLEKTRLLAMGRTLSLLQNGPFSRYKSNECAVADKGKELGIILYLL